MDECGKGRAALPDCSVGDQKGRNSPEFTKYSGKCLTADLTFRLSKCDPLSGGFAHWSRPNITVCVIFAPCVYALES